ncbi:MAG: hypothetical protein COA58_02510 [Bacteroidetes bacterium]|nr:MAG: hypothetical protein COA58_02510 [Bacteroidota bacterium]
MSLLFLDKGELVLNLNYEHTPLLDKVFIWITKGGEILGGVVVVLSLLVLKNKRNIVVLVAAVLLSLAVSQLLKHVVFKNEGRPSSVYENLEPIDGVTRHKNNSFPSGHTTAAFTFFTVLAVSFKKKSIQFVAPLLASLVGISRVYLGQHYLNDVVVGAILGLFITSITIILLNRFVPIKVE